MPFENFTYGGHIIEVSNLPEASLSAMIRRGLVHFLGNEQASKVAAKVKSQESGENPTVATDEDKAAWKAEFVTNAVAALLAGTVGVRAVGEPREKSDPVGSLVRKLAKAAVTKILSDNGIKVPKKDEKVKTASGEFTMTELVDRRIASQGETLRAEAEKEIAAQARKTAKAVEGAGLSDL